MKVSLSAEAVTKVRADLLAVGVRTGDAKRSKLIKDLDRASGGAIGRAITLEAWTGKPGEALRVGVSGIGAPAVLLVGVAKATPAPRAARAVAARAAAGASKYRSVAIALEEDDEASIEAAAEGAVTGAYRYVKYLTGDRRPKRIVDAAKLVVAKVGKPLKDAAARGVIRGEAINLARDLVNAPPNDLTPTALAQAAESACREHGVTVKSWDKKALQKLGAHLFLAVNRGSAEEPRMVHMTWKPKSVTPGSPRVVFVGKGLTFDSGGLCLKPPNAMADMKCDMAGAAVTIGIMVAVARLGLPIEVHGLFGATENMTGAAAYRPGDVFPTLDGKSVEIINTDAEGRLVLADVLTYARQLEPDYLIDHATLTGACVVALGPYTSGLFTGDDELAADYSSAATDEGESFWRLPLNDDLRDVLRSDVADLKHVGDRYGGSITAALFLREFVGDTKWMHLDIAGPAFLERAHGTMPKGGTGFGIATALRFLERKSRPATPA